MHRVVSDYTRVDGNSTNIKVFVRARPVDEGVEQSDFLSVEEEDARKIVIRDPDASNRRYSEVGFQFDKVFWTSATQEEIFSTACKPSVDHVLNGFNSCCFACKYSYCCLLIHHFCDCWNYSNCYRCYHYYSLWYSYCCCYSCCNC